MHISKYYACRTFKHKWFSYIQMFIEEESIGNQFINMVRHVVVLGFKF